MIVLRNVEVCVYFISSSVETNLSILYLGTLNIFLSNATIGTCLGLANLVHVIYKGETPLASQISDVFVIFSD